MTLLTGCFKPSDKKIVEKFDDFITMFPTEDLTVLYAKEENNVDLKNGDLGTWVISSYLDTKDEEGSESVGISLKFNRNTKEAKGDFILDKTINGAEIDDKYPIYYDKDGIHFIDENIDKSVKEELSKFNMAYNFISLNMEYLDSLDQEKVSYNGEAPLYEVKYKLNSDDVNIKKIKEIYPNLPIDENNLSLSLSGQGTPWNAASRLSLEIFLDDCNNNYFTCAMSLKRSDLFE